MFRKNIGLYIHVPFCVNKCPYCDFYSIKVCDEYFDKYTEAIIRNVKYYTEKFDVNFDTIYFGGGTPSLLPEKNIYNILNELSKYYLSNATEITLEVNPETIDKTKLDFLKKNGINRLSFGVQSCVDSELEILGRIHNYSKAEKVVETAYEIGIENISCDLMIGISEQSFESLNYSIEKLCSLPIKHISAYILKIENKTPYSLILNRLSLPEEDTIADMYLLAIESLKKHGFNQYEISNFSKKNYESKHNLKYWNCEEYLGVGPSAHSYLNGKRFEVERSIDKFISTSLQKEIIKEENPGDFFEKMMLKLRLSKGINLKKVALENFKNINMLQKAGLIELKNDRLFLTEKGFLVSNSVISSLLF